MNDRISKTKIFVAAFTVAILYLAIISSSLLINVPHELVAKKSKKLKTVPFLQYENPDYKIAIQYPSNWKISEENLRSHQVVVFSAPEKTQKLTKLSSIIFIPAQFGIAVEPLASKNTTILQYISQFFKLGYHGVSNYKIVNSSKTMLAGVPAESIIMYDYLNNHTSEVMRIIGIDNGTAYRIGYYAEPGTFSTYLPVIEQMIASFRINTGLTSP